MDSIEYLEAFNLTNMDKIEDKFLNLDDWDDKQQSILAYFLKISTISCIFPLTQFWKIYLIVLQTILSHL